MYSFCRTSCTPNKDLLQSFTPSSAERIYAKMFGFRFSNSEYITIQCEVGIFPPPSNPIKVNSDSVVICSCNNLKDDVSELTSFIYVNI